MTSTFPLGSQEATYVINTSYNRSTVKTLKLLMMIRKGTSWTLNMHFTSERLMSLTFRCVRQLKLPRLWEMLIAQHVLPWFMKITCHNHSLELDRSTTNDNYEYITYAYITMWMIGPPCFFIQNITPQKSLTVWYPPELLHFVTSFNYQTRIHVTYKVTKLSEYVSLINKTQTTRARLVIRMWNTHWLMIWNLVARQSCEYMIIKPLVYFLWYCIQQVISIIFLTSIIIHWVSLLSTLRSKNYYFQWTSRT